MQLLWNAVRAVTVETLGVLFVVWLLFHTAGWTMTAWNLSSAAEFDDAWNKVDPASEQHALPLAASTPVCWNGQARATLSEAAAISPPPYAPRGRHLLP